MKKEMSRIRSLVDKAYKLDPRIQRYKQEDKDTKITDKEDARSHQKDEEQVNYKYCSCKVIFMKKEE